MHLRYGSHKISVDRRPYPEIAALPLPTLGPNTTEPLPLNEADYNRKGSFETWQDALFQFGIAHMRVDDSALSDAARALYDELFCLTRGSYLYRIWNYIPKLNSGEGDEERYRQFSFGRSCSFRQEFGENDTSRMPAGTCVGIQGEQMAICFLSGITTPDHHENPNQIPAYRYPRQYGPKSPSFARATSVSVLPHHYRFISGTAAVTGHESMGVGDLEKQIRITCDNIDQIANQTQELSEFSDDDQSLYACKVYLRHANDYPTARRLLQNRFPQIEEQFVYLQSDICRKELLIEIELSYRDSVRQHHLL